MRSPSVSIRADVLEELQYAVGCQPDAYQACVLLGTAEPSGVSVLGYSDLSACGGPIAFAHELLTDWTPMVRRLKRESPGLRVLGWATYSPHRSLMALDANEQVAHRTFFNLPHQMCLALAPDNAVCAFGLDEAGLLTERPVDVTERPEEGVSV